MVGKALDFHRKEVVWFSGTSIVLDSIPETRVQFPDDSTIFYSLVHGSL